MTGRVSFNLKSKLFVHNNINFFEKLASNAIFFSSAIRYISTHGHVHIKITHLFYAHYEIIMLEAKEGQLGCVNIQKV